MISSNMFSIENQMQFISLARNPREKKRNYGKKNMKKHELSSFFIGVWTTAASSTSHVYPSLCVQFVFCCFHSCFFLNLTFFYISYDFTLFFHLFPFLSCFSFSCLFMFFNLFYFLFSLEKNHYQSKPLACRPTTSFC